MYHATSSSQTSPKMSLCAVKHWEKKNQPIITPPGGRRIPSPAYMLPNCQQSGGDGKGPEDFRRTRQAPTAPGTGAHFLRATVHPDLTLRRSLTPHAFHNPGQRTPLQGLPSNSNTLLAAERFCHESSVFSSSPFAAVRRRDG